MTIQQVPHQGVEGAACAGPVPRVWTIASARDSTLAIASFSIAIAQIKRLDTLVENLFKFLGPGLLLELIL